MKRSKPNGSPVREARLEKGWTMRELAERAQVCKANIWVMECRPFIHVDHYARMRVANQLGKKLFDLFPQEEEIYSRYTSMYRWALGGDMKKKIHGQVWKKEKEL